ncbi:MAG: helix-turn-helix transcriptional regulator [Clostridia bacterium]|nr:helix-turn-helix transcriptional regulator [Clostridia bacterium]
MVVSEKIQLYRKKAGLSQEELARMLFVSRQTVSLWETGQTLPTIDNLIRLREIFGVSLDAILCDDTGEADNTVDALVDQPSFEYSVSYTEEERERIKRAYVMPRYTVSAIISVLIAVILVLAPRIHGAFILSLGVLLALLTVALTVCVYETVNYDKRVGVSYSLRALLKLYEEHAVAEYIDEVGDTVCLTRSNISDLRLDTRVSGYIGVCLGGKTVYVSEGEVEDGAYLCSVKPSFRFTAVLTWILSGLLALAVGFLVISLTVNVRLQRTLAEASVRIPDYVSLSEKDDMGLVNGKYVEYFAEIFFSDSDVADFEREIATDKNWKGISDLDGDTAGLIPDAGMYKGAEFFVFVGDDSEGYILITYFADENLMKVVRFDNR